jgi:hypothetical protein
MRRQCSPFNTTSSCNVPTFLGEERELGKNPLHFAMYGSKGKKKPSTPNGNSQGKPLTHSQKKRKMKANTYPRKLQRKKN